MVNALLIAIMLFEQETEVSQAETKSRNFKPVLSAPLPDPFVYREEDHWYIFGTASYFFQGKSLLPEAMKRKTLELDCGLERPRIQIWAFSVYRHIDNSYHAYATLHCGLFRTVVAHFLPQSGEVWQVGKPITRWKLDKVLVGDIDKGDCSSYDSRLMRDKDGALYLIYNAAAERHADVHIYAQKMLDPGTVAPDWQPRKILSPGGYRSEDRNLGYSQQIVEGTTIVKLKDKHVLLYSVGDFASNRYKIGVAYSDSLIPPVGKTYQKVLIPDPNKLWGNSAKGEEVCYLLQSEKREWHNYCGHVVSGPGIGTIIQSEGRYWVIFHGYPPHVAKRHPARRLVWRLPVEVQISEGRPMSEWIRPIFPE